jgi:hypothetical protein
MSTINELEQIIRTGSITQKFNVLQYKVEMRTLTSQEIWDIMKETSGFDELAKFHGIKIKTLARSIIGLNGTKIEYANTNAEENITEQKKIEQNEKIIGKWQGVVADLFYEKYIELKGDQEDFLEKSLTSSKKDGVEKNGTSENKQA